MLCKTCKLKFYCSKKNLHRNLTKKETKPSLQKLKLKDKCNCYHLANLEIIVIAISTKEISVTNIIEILE